MNRLLIVGAPGWRDFRRVSRVVAELLPGWPNTTLLHTAAAVGAEAAKTWGRAGGRTERVTTPFDPLRQGPDGPDLSVVFLVGDDPTTLAWLREATAHPWAPHMLVLGPSQRHPALVDT